MSLHQLLLLLLFLRLLLKPYLNVDQMPTKNNQQSSSFRHFCFFCIHEDVHVILVHYAFSRRLFRQDLVEQDQAVLQLTLMLPRWMRKRKTRTRRAHHIDKTCLIALVAHRLFRFRLIAKNKMFH